MECNCTRKKCRRHGKCAECRAFMAKRNEPTYCEKQKNQKADAEKPKEPITYKPVGDKEDI